MNENELGEAIRRGFSRYILDRSIGEVLERKKQRRPAVRRATQLAVSLVAATLGVVAVLVLAPWNSQRMTFASWSAAPKHAAPALVAAVASRCDAVDPRAADLPIVGSEQRGQYVVVFRSDGDRFAVCIAGPSPDEVLWFHGEDGGVLSPVPPDEGPIGGVTVLGPGDPVAAEVVIVIGRVSPDVAKVEVERGDGVMVSATVGKGYFLAWWPGSADMASVVAYDAAGAEWREPREVLDRR